jgi:hypothetical protein
MKTAMQWLQERYNNNINLTLEDFKEALEKEKEQIVNAHTEGYSNYDSEMTSIEYFNQTYNN